MIIKNCNGSLIEITNNQSENINYYHQIYINKQQSITANTNNNANTNKTADTNITSLFHDIKFILKNSE